MTPPATVQPPPPPPNTKQTPLLNKYGLVVNTRFRILICVGCQGIINPRGVRQHFLNYHKELQTPIDLQEYLEEEVLKKYPDLTHNPLHPMEPVDSIYGLAPPGEGYLCCLSCNRCYSQKKTFEKHSCESPSSSWSLSRAQRFIDNNLSPWFPVRDPPPIPSPQRDPWTLFEAQCRKRSQPTVTAALSDDYRVLHQFLRKERWFEQVGERQHEDLMPLVTYTVRDKIYGNVHKDIHAFFATTQASLNSHYLSRLVSTRPAEEHDETRLRHHRDVNPQTHANYARIIAGLVAFVHRITTEDGLPYSCPVPSDIATACEELIAELSHHSKNRSVDDTEAIEIDGEIEKVYEGGDREDNGIGGSGKNYEYAVQDEDSTAAPNTTDISNKHPHPHLRRQRVPQSTPELQEKLQSFLYLLFTQTPTSELRGNFCSPVTHYIILVSMRKNQEWAAAGTITHYIAAILFTGRLVFAGKVMKECENLKGGYSE